MRHARPVRTSVLPFLVALLVAGGCTSGESLAETDPDFWPATVMQRSLGEGFDAKLNQVLRVEKGYTYWIDGGFYGTDLPGDYAIGSAVRSNVTLEALALIKELVEGHARDLSDDDLEVTRGFLARRNAAAYWLPLEKRALLGRMSAYGFPADYLRRREAEARKLTLPQARALAGRYLDPRGMVWLVVGDARTQLGRLEALGLGPPVLLDREGRPLAPAPRTGEARP